MDAQAALETLYLTCHRRDDSDVLPPHSLRDTVATAQPWTTTRCHRLLRPLISHLAALLKEEVRITAQRRDMAAEGRSLELERLTDPSKQSPLSEPGTGSKRVRYTYSSRRRRHQQPTMTFTAIEDTFKPAPSTQHRQQLAGRYVSPGEIVVPTPVLCRATKQKRAFSLPSSPLGSRTCTKTTSERGSLPTSPSRCGIPVYRGHCNGAFNNGGSINTSSNPAMKDDWARLCSATLGKRFQLYESIFRAIEALLRATSAGPTVTTAKKQKPKPRSLLEMCLRTVPQYVAACEAEERQEAVQSGTTPPASSQISFEVYADLESLGHGADGWQHLRTVVRSHAISLVAAACADGLLHSAFVRILIRLLMLLGAHTEAESLLVAFVWRSGSYPMPLEGAESVFSRAPGSLEPLRILVEYAEETGRWSCLFQQLDGLLQSGRLPPAWLSTLAFSGIWERIVQISSSCNISTGEGQSSRSFAETAIARLIHCQPGDDLDVPIARPSSLQPLSSTSSSSYHTLASVLGSLAAVAILQREAVADVEDGPAEHDVPSLRRLAIIVETCLASDPAGKKKRRVRRSLNNQMSETRKRFLLGLARFLSSFGANMTNMTESCDRAASWCEEISLRSGPEQRRQLYDATITLVASVAQSCGRGAAATTDAKPARVYLAQLCSSVTGRLGSCFSPLNARDVSAKRMHADGAFLLASRTNDLRDLAFAESLGVAKAQRRPQRCGLDDSFDSVETSPEAVVSAPPAAVSPTALFAGYRWEEGISEWVIASPEPERRTLVTRSRSPALASLSNVSVEDADHVTPRKAPRLRDMTTPESAASDQHVHRAKRLRLGRKSWAGELSRSSRAKSWSIASLVSDGDDDTSDDRDGFDEISIEIQRGPLFRVDSIAPTPVGLGLGKRKRALARSSLRLNTDDASDDELCM
ncbi:hypothetical protein CMQ_4168 [Grosmannia clavigera kw1407]|uniref:Uncharacterized protein n=1 Tax=Grosmannia clavigera (strain kw1407 / UAMH 11150) TaxID=655863 RepID=F0XAL4_GROCL|nr:uncharacterized protein CMQ_4168 [Grosmannia clavigera kw1407]EFX06099.1 hypothetical protein CMQ_4168 [Grosmannia clavigera kw1407]